MERAEQIYNDLLKSGMFWEFYPQLSGEWERDKEKWEVIVKEQFVEGPCINYEENLIPDFDGAGFPKDPVVTNLSEMIKIAEEDGLVMECVWSALQEMKQDPSLGIDEAFQLGMSEWIKE